MSLTGHIICKDVGRLKWLLLVWVCLGFYVLLTVAGASIGPRFFFLGPVLGVVAFIALSVALVAWTIQEDEVTQTAAFWRTRPISPGRLLGAKLTFLITFFVVIPLIGISSGRQVALFSEIAIMLLTYVLLLAAVASCTKDLGRYFLVVLACYLVFGLIAGNFANLGLSRVRISGTLATLLLATWAGSAVLILLNQYYRRSIARSVGIVGAVFALNVVILIFVNATSD